MTDVTVLSYADIRAKGACTPALSEVSTWYPDGFPLTEEAVTRLVGHSLDWGLWLLEMMAPAPAWTAYRKVEVPAWAGYRKVRAAAWAEYQKVRDAACAKFEDAAWPEYEKVTDAAWAEYTKVRAAALAEYAKVEAAALVDALVAWGRGDYAEVSNG